MGSGTTTTLLTLIDAMCAATTPAHTHVYAIDARGDDRLQCLVHRPHVGAVVRATDGERLRRLLLRLDGELDARIDDPVAERPEIVVAIDGITALRNELTSLDRTDLLATLARVVADGPPVEIRTVFTTVDHTALPGTFATAQAWTFLRGIAPAPGARTPATDAPPGRIRISPAGRIAQVVLDPRTAADVADPRAAAGGATGLALRAERTTRSRTTRMARLRSTCCHARWRGASSSDTTATRPWRGSTHTC